MANSKKHDDGEKGKTPNKPGVRSSKGIIFRRFITLRNGRVLDAHDYGHRAWPIGSRR